MTISFEYNRLENKKSIHNNALKWVRFLSTKCVDNFVENYPCFARVRYNSANSGICLFFRQIHNYLILLVFYKQDESIFAAGFKLK